MARTASPQHTAATRLRHMAEALLREMPSATMELHHRSPWELLIATILSAQCTDQRVNQVTPTLFKRYRTPAALGSARLSDVEAIIRSTGFFKNKAKNIVACSQTLTERFKGQVPNTMDELITLPGVGRKTANVVLGNAYHQPAIVVDTHVKRVSARLGLTRSTDPDQIERELQQLLPASQWTAVSQRLLLHGRYLCLARKPQCHRCPIHQWCTSKEKNPT